jgi:hypothetical protein
MKNFKVLNYINFEYINKFYFLINSFKFTIKFFLNLKNNNKLILMFFIVKLVFSFKFFSNFIILLLNSLLNNNLPS